MIAAAAIAGQAAHKIFFRRPYVKVLVDTGKENLHTREKRERERGNENV